jgi:glycosyltransferase involved in cell wall biosynthesis
MFGRLTRMTSEPNRHHSQGVTPSSRQNPGRAMRVLVLAPHPYFQVRGTPIDLDLVLRVLSARSDVEVDVVVYNEGEDRHFRNIRLHRIPDLPFLRGVRPGFSVRKLACDAFLFARAWSLMRRRYDVVHAGEEAVFMAMVFKWLYGVPYLYDLDSSIAQQMVEKLPFLRPLRGLFNWMESRAIRGALFALPVCDALADLCRRQGAKRVMTLHDISLLADPHAPQTGCLKEELGIKGTLMLYAGNLEAYQGVDLLLESFAIALRATQGVDLAIIGGTPREIVAYREMAGGLGIEKNTHFLGPRPLEELNRSLAEADILVSPRIRGINTPMKVFPYLHSGRAVLATDLPTHSQILTPEVAMLAAPTPDGFAEAIVRLTEDAEANHTFQAHTRRLNEIYDFVKSRLPYLVGTAMQLTSDVAEVGVLDLLTAL